MLLWHHIRERVQYPKFITLGFSIVLAYLLYRQGAFVWVHHVLNGRGYVSTFVAGLFFTFGFTSAFSVALFIEVADSVNPVLAAVLAGIGAAISDMTIFQFIRFSLEDELVRLQCTRTVTRIRDLFTNHHILRHLKMYLIWALAAFFIASPLPDEIAITMLNGMCLTLNRRLFALLCFTLNTIGILVIFLAARAL